MGKLKTTVCRVLIVANLLAVILLLLIGNADLLRPEDWPRLCNAGLLMPFVLALNVAFLFLWCVVRPSRLWLPLVGLLLAYVPVRKYTPFNPKEEPSHGALKILSWNVAQFNGYKPEEAERNVVMRYLLDSRADIICLQEAPVNGGSNSPQKILKAKYPYVEVMKKTPTGADCLILASRYPILRSDSIPYNSPGNMSVEYIVKVDGREISIISNHLETNGLTAKDKKSFHQMMKGGMARAAARTESRLLSRKLSHAAVVRASQARIVSGRIQQRIREQMPVIAVGDFNDTPISYARRTIAKGMTDCYIASGNGPGTTYNRNGIYARIDHILCSDFFKPYGAKVDNSIKTSDHYPIYCWLEMRPKP